MKINKIGIVVLLSLMLTSCVVSTVAKVVTTTAKIGYSAVKGTVKGISWTLKKAEGKIDEHRLNGTWRVVGIYNGNFDQFSKDKDPETNFKSEGVDGFEILEFKSKRGKFQPVHNQSENGHWIKYKFNFGRNPATKNKENYLKYNSTKYISVIDVTAKTMVLEGNLMKNHAINSGKLYLFEKVK